jgi:hypothetical protein
MTNDFVTLTTYTYNTEAYILVAKLEAEGIRCFLKNENLLSTQQFLSNAVGGLDVQVMKNDLHKAREILDLMKEQENAKEAEASLPKDYEKVLTYCPECESANVCRKKGSLFAFGAKEHICLDCLHKWKQ